MSGVVFLTRDAQCGGAHKFAEASCGRAADADGGAAVRALSPSEDYRAR